ncbi:hypothetical protein HBH98_003530 [Parastagonospora nodorum]|nr:hypothetical protein HBH42_163240 [Parastagonospora nodorum]KAH4214679.1 hypothetical protein HBI95_011620 [Parastagonospora nodorum]KAH4298392.1 hypothetical protein HBI01_129470 [Parastagonospora nodorum]KAH4317804.1 hypothetical protein HBI02_015550 [Parastagonospora nodorum]KAH4326813.1 hypothetical protein HBI00_132050 [Parastagonospora nodorum]
MDADAAVEPVVEAQSGKKKRFRCEHCSRLFARLEHLQRHERIHSGVKPFSCAECNYSFTRSDLLVRHERLTHRKDRENQKDRAKPSNEPSHALEEEPSRKRVRASLDTGRPVPEIPGMISSPAVSEIQPIRHTPATSFSPVAVAHDSSYSLAALSMAAEYQSLQGNMASGDPVDHNLTSPSALPSATMNVTFDPAHTVMPSHPDFNGHGPSLEESLDSLTYFLDNEPLNSYHFATLMSAEQPMPFFSPESLVYNQDVLPPAETAAIASSNLAHAHADEGYSLSRFGSRFPSLQPEDLTDDSVSRRRSFSDISHADRQKILDKLEEFSDIVPKDFQLPTRLAMCRYIAAYTTGFHEHMPFLHIPTMCVDTCSIELILALAAIGAQYTFEGEKGVELFTVSRAIATQRIKRRDARLINRHHNDDLGGSIYDFDMGGSAQSPQPTRSVSGPLGLPSETEATSMGDDLIQTAQALLLLMALCTWAKHKEILREALAIQSVLATLIRDDGLQSEPFNEDMPWLDWVRWESIKRTKFIVYGFSNLHCIVYNIPPFMLTSEIRLTLPCTQAEFKAPTATLWKEARKNRAPEVYFQDALKRLFSKNGRDVTLTTSSSGNYALIHALIQHVFFLRQVTSCRSDGPGDLSQEDIASVETALRNWQIGWRRNPESSVDPWNADGPVAFNSTALLRLAYIRLYVDTAGRALETRDPELIANAFRSGPTIRRSAKITRAVLHSAHALSIPIKMGYRLVAKTQSFIWSIQHSLCTLECAYLMSKWLEALSAEYPDPPASEDERRIVAIVKSMLDETEFALSPTISIDSPNYTKHLSAGMLRVWAMIFKGSQTWAIVDVIGSALNLYADMLVSG